jgi:hypothetical protein
MLFILVLNISSTHAAWSDQQEIISGKSGPGAGQFGLRSEDGYSVEPYIEFITPDKQVIVSDLVNRKQMVFSAKGALIHELKWGKEKGQEGKTIAPLSQRDRETSRVYSLKISATAYRITIVFPDRNLVVDSDEDFRTAARDDAGFVYGIGADTVIRFDKNGKKTAALPLPKAHEELVPVPDQRSPRGVYIEYGNPVIAPNGDVYLWQRSGEKFSILKWTWQ